MNDSFLAGVPRLADEGAQSAHLLRFPCFSSLWRTTSTPYSSKLRDLASERF